MTTLKLAPTVVLAAALLVPAAAPAAKPVPKLVLTVTPAAPKANQTLTIRFRADGKLKPGERYHVRLVSANAHRYCDGERDIPIRGFVARGKLVTVRTGSPAPTSSWRWCAGKMRAELYALTADGDLGADPPKPVSTTFTITADAGYPALTDESLGTPIEMTVLGSSTLTVTAPGRMDRTLMLGGLLSGYIPGRFVLNTDYSIKILKGALELRSLVTDPLCAGATYPLTFPVAEGAASTATFLRSGAVTTTIALDADPLSFAGCAGAAGGTTALTLTGVLAEKKLADITLSGSVAGVPIAAGVTGSVAVNLHLKVAILDD